MKIESRSPSLWEINVYLWSETLTFSQRTQKHVTEMKRRFIFSMKTTVIAASFFSQIENRRALVIILLLEDKSGLKKVNMALFT